MRPGMPPPPIVVALATLLAPAATAAQIGNPLPQALGMGDNYTALARGIGAPAWNPAGLGMPESRGVSFSILPFDHAVGVGPVGLSDLAEYSGEFVPHDQRVEWLDRITASGGEAGNVATDLTFAALSVGRIAFSASSSVRGRVNMAPDVVEIFLFGNAGLTGDPRDYALTGSSFDVSGTTTFAASTAVPLQLTLGPLPDQHFSLGATLKYTVGNFLLLGQENGSTLESSPLAVAIEFPVVHTRLPDSEEDHDLFRDILSNGSGIGVDVGAAWQGGIFSAGAVIKNLINTFGWHDEALEYRQGTAVWNADTSHTSFEERPIGDAPAAITDRIDQLYTFSPILAAGAAARVLPFLTVTGDVRHALHENLDVGAQSHVGVGAELTVLPMVPIRAGLTVLSGGYQVSGGLGLRLGPVHLSGAAAARSTDLGDDAVAALGLTFEL